MIREATIHDLPAIVALLTDDPLGRTREAASIEPYRQAFARMAEQPDNWLLVDDDQGLVRACAQYTVIHGLSRSGMSRAQIEGIRVAPAWRGQGIGHRFIGALIDRARADGCGMIQLTTDTQRTDARRFYLDLGFVASHIGMKMDLARAD